ncbi:hypothetical protein IE077_000793 [Cardiosporidium cionae]|uniref:Uncharacterized protein n=1 Tax=Cardiosporidium cionae TaxID=476202 RepID=A0ABQ7J6K0_9APIC|nr:hypothetical protein IE077_000793 [Cardiosporidium cionae]|eukprot:KAF8819591.1 hypothetical protein IE077_000793 [Cardiosporidium cionae]
MQNSTWKNPALKPSHLQTYSFLFHQYIYITCSSYFILSLVYFNLFPASAAVLRDLVQDSVSAQKPNNPSLSCNPSEFRFPKLHLASLAKHAQYQGKNQRTHPCLTCSSLSQSVTTPSSSLKFRYNSPALLQLPMQSSLALQRLPYDHSSNSFPSLLSGWRVYGKATHTSLKITITRGKEDLLNWTRRVPLAWDTLITRLGKLLRLTLVTLVKFFPLKYFQYALHRLQDAPAPLHGDEAQFDYTAAAEGKADFIALPKRFYTIEDSLLDFSSDIFDTRMYGIFSFQPKKNIKDSVAARSISSLNVKPLYEIAKSASKNVMAGNNQEYAHSLNQDKSRERVDVKGTQSPHALTKDGAYLRNKDDGMGDHFSINRTEREAFPLNTEICKKDSEEKVTNWYIQQFSHILEHIVMLEKSLNESGVGSSNDHTYYGATGSGKAEILTGNDPSIHAPIMERKFDPSAGPIVRFYQWEFAKCTKDYPKNCLIYGEADENALVVRPRGEENWVSFSALNRQRRLTPEAIGGLWFGKYNTSWDPILILASTSDLAITALLDHPKIIQSAIVGTLVSILWLSREEAAFLLLHFITSKVFLRMHPFWCLLLYAAPPFKLLLIRCILSTFNRFLRACESIVRNNLIQLESHRLSQTIQALVNTTSL